MRHEARQVPSWLIFDVGQRFALTVNISRSHILCLVALQAAYLLGAESRPSSGGARGDTDDTRSHPVPVLVGIFTIGAETRFRIGFLEGERPTNQTWAKIGEKPRGLELKHYDHEQEVLFAQYDDSHVYKLRLNEGRVTSPKPAMTRTQAKVYLEEQLERLKRGRDEMPVLGNVTLISDDKLQPDEKKRYDFAKAKAKELGNILLVVEVDGAVRTIESNAASNSLPDFVRRNLTVDDQTEYDLEHLFVTAEFMESARKSNRTKPVVIPKSR